MLKHPDWIPGHPQRCSYLWVVIRINVLWVNDDDRKLFCHLAYPKDSNIYFYLLFFKVSFCYVFFSVIYRIFFFSFQSASMAYGSSQTRGWIRPTAGNIVVISHMWLLSTWHVASLKMPMYIKYLPDCKEVVQKKNSLKYLYWSHVEILLFQTHWVKYIKNYFTFFNFLIWLL